MHHAPCLHPFRPAPVISHQAHVTLHTTEMCSARTMSELLHDDTCQNSSCSRGGDNRPYCSIHSSQKPT